MPRYFPRKSATYPFTRSSCKRVNRYRAALFRLYPVFNYAVDLRVMVSRSPGRRAVGDRLAPSDPSPGAAYFLQTFCQLLPVVSLPVKKRGSGVPVPGGSTLQSRPPPVKLGGLPVISLIYPYKPYTKTRTPSALYFSGLPDRGADCFSGVTGLFFGGRYNLIQSKITEQPRSRQTFL